MPSTADAVTLLPFRHARTDLDNLAYDLVTGNARKRAEACGLDKRIRVADTACFHLDENLTLFGMLELDLPERERLVGLFKDGRLVGLGKRRHVCFWSA